VLVKNEESNLKHINGKTLMPGVNVVDPKWWANAKKHPSVKKLLDAATLTEEMDPQEAEDAEALGDEGASEAVIDHITTQTVNQARGLVNDTVDVDLLKKWLARDERKSVKEAITKQLAKLEAEPEMRDRTKSRQITTGKGPDVVEVNATPGAQDD
jgi:hypothetical protein